MNHTQVMDAVENAIAESRAEAKAKCRCGAVGDENNPLHWVFGRWVCGDCLYDCGDHSVPVKPEDDGEEW